MTSDKPKKPRGFAAMSPELRRELSRRGGKAVDPSNRPWSKDRTLASAMSRKSHVSRKAAAE